MTSVRTDPAYPCQATPPIKPFNGFDIDGETDRAIATRIIAEILADDEWHTRRQIFDELEYELDWPDSLTRKLLGCLKSHGDIRTDNVGNYRLTTRWRKYADTKTWPTAAAAREEATALLAASIHISRQADPDNLDEQPGTEIKRPKGVR